MLCLFLHLFVFVITLECQYVDEVQIGALFPMFTGPAGNYSYQQTGQELFGAFLFAVREINNKADGVADFLLPNTTIKFVYRDDKVSEVVSMRATMDVLERSNCEQDGTNCRGVLAVVGPLSSGATINSQYICVQMTTPQISGSAVSVQLSDSVANPFFLRTIPSDLGRTAATARVAASFGWSCVSTISGSDAFSTTGIKAFIDRAASAGMTIVKTLTITDQQPNATQEIRNLKDGRCPLIVGWGQEAHVQKILFAAYYEGLYGPPYQWMWGQTLITNNMLKTIKSTIGENATANLLKGVLSLSSSAGEGSPYHQTVSERWAAQNSTYSKGTCRKDVDDDKYSPTYIYQQDDDGNPQTPMKCGGANYNKNNFVNWAIYTYDAVFAIAYSLHKLIYTQGRNPCPRSIYQSTKAVNSSNNCFTGTELFKMMANIQFFGVSGNVSFGPNNGDRGLAGSTYLVYSHNGNQSLESFPLVATYIPVDNGVSRLVQCSSCAEMVWPDGRRGLENAPVIALLDDKSVKVSSSSGVNPAILVAVLVPLALILIVGGAFLAWNWTSNYRKLRKLYSDENVATQCAEAIAKLDFSSVTFLNQIEHPNRIQRAFIHITTILKEVVTFIPDAILQTVKYDPSQELDGDDDLTKKPIVIMPEVASIRNNNNLTPRAPSNFSSHRESRIGNVINVTGNPIGLSSFWRPRRVTTLKVRYDVGTIGNDPIGVRDKFASILKPFVALVKDHRGTVDSITPTSATALWNAYAGFVGSSALLACEVALNLIASIQDGNITIGITHEQCMVGQLSTSHGSYLMVVGDGVWLAEKISKPGRHQRLRTRILMDASVYQLALYSHKVRIVDVIQHSDSKMIPVYELLSTTCQSPAVEEWMYQLGDSTKGNKATSPYEQAFIYFMQGKHDLCMSCLRTYLMANPTDAPARVLMERVDPAVHSNKHKTDITDRKSRSITSIKPAEENLDLLTL